MEMKFETNEGGKTNKKKLKTRTTLKLKLKWQSFILKIIMNRNSRLIWMRSFNTVLLRSLNTCRALYNSVLNTFNVHDDGVSAPMSGLWTEEETHRQHRQYLFCLLFFLNFFLFSSSSCFLQSHKEFTQFQVFSMKLPFQLKCPIERKAFWWND